MTPRGAIWFAFAAISLVMLDTLDLDVWALLVSIGALAVLAIPAARPPSVGHVDRQDLVAIGVGYVVVVALFRIAFTVFGTDQVLGLFLCFAAGLLVGVVGPVVNEIWRRGRDLRSLGVGLHHFPETAAAALTLGAIQFAMTLWGYDLPAGEDWVPLLVMSLVVGWFEAIFFRGFIQNRLESSFGTATGVVLASMLYALYHVGYGMALDEIWFLFGLGLVYAIAFRLVRNVFVLWPLLTPLGAFYNNLTTGDIELPWASIAGFADVAAVMAIAVWLAHRHVRRRERVMTDPDRSVPLPR